MAKLGRILGKIATGAASVAVPAALANQAAQIQEKRDARLQKYQTGENTLNRAATADLAASNREATKELQDARIASVEKEGSANRESNRELQDDRLDSSEGVASANRMQNMQIFKASQAERDARLELLESQLTGSDLQNEMDAITKGRAESLQKTLDVINNSDAPIEQREAAMESYLLQNPDARKKVIVKQKEDKHGNKIDEYAIFDSATGGRMDNPGGALEPKDGREVHDMFKAGKMPRNVAEAWLEYMAR